MRFTATDNYTKAVFVLFFAMAVKTSCFAQGLPTTQERRNDEREAQQRSQAEPNVDVRLTAPAVRQSPRLPESETPCFPIDSLKIEGEDAKEFAWLTVTDRNSAYNNDANDFYWGRCVGANGVQILVDRLQNKLVERGYITTRVEARTGQSLQSGVLTVTVYPGKLGAIRWADAAQNTVALWNTMPSSIGSTLTLWDIEQALENLRRVPTAEANIQIAPAERQSNKSDDAGYSDLFIERAQKLPLRLALSVDDSGSPSTGVYQGSATISWDNPLGLSDTFYVVLNHDLGGGDDEPRGTRGSIIHYSLPIGYWALGVTSSRNHYYQTVVGNTQNYVYSGDSENNEVKLSRVMHRNGTGKVTTSLKAFQRKSNNYIDDTEVEVQRRIVGGYELDITYRGKLNQVGLDARIAYKRGTGDFDSIPAPEEKFGEGSSRMELFNTDATINVPFSLLEKRFDYTANWRAQFDRTVLSPQDRFAIGGRYTVRGFDGQNSLSAERGWLLRNEASIWLSDLGLQAYLAIDYGEVSGPSAQYLAGTSLAGGVLGIRGEVGKLQFDIYAGGPISKPDQFSTASTTAGFVISASF